MNSSCFEGSNQDEPLNITNTGKRRSSILPLVKKHMTNTGFIMAFVNRIGKAEQEGELQAEVASNVFRDIFFNFASDFKVECQDEEIIGSGGWGYTAKKNRYDTLLSTLAEGQSLGLLVDYALHFRSYDKVGEILHEMNSYPRGVTVLTMKKPIIPFLKSFSHTLVKHSILGSEEKDDRQRKALPLELFEKSLQGIPQDLLLKLCQDPSPPTNELDSQYCQMHLHRLRLPEQIPPRPNEASRSFPNGQGPQGTSSSRTEYLHQVPAYHGALWESTNAGGHKDKRRIYEGRYRVEEEVRWRRWESSRDSY